ncbi:SRPBCC domain-containing protein [Pontivivens ytuae]|uniref:SRPBCC domain-containing protein n=1 Tax=Pontivivens ytuae TaxID=2789856 RepID=A0A7S9LSG2_9RHOB|nr:SRPBCC domain-containing protein [Pontivivens ytuae]QPH54464.1 SRPBCC domain-containing protein [Pontivivens ytuae]
MTGLDHQSFTLTRDYKADHARVYDAWARPEAKRRWFAENPGKSHVELRHWEMDFRPGGTERGEFLVNGSEINYRGRYVICTRPGRLIYNYDMDADGEMLSASLVAVSMEEAKDGCRLTYTEHIVFIDGRDKLEYRVQGTEELLDKLGHLLVPA